MVDGKMFVYSEDTGEVREHKTSGGGLGGGGMGNYKWLSVDSLESL